VTEKPVAPVAVGPAVQPTPAATATGGNWWAQLGSFSSRDNAERLQKQLRAAGFPVSVSPIKSNGKELYRVRAGPVASREAAAGLQGRLAAAGHKSSLVAP
jgi:cell division septation protein DedD